MKKNIIAALAAIVLICPSARLFAQPGNPQTNPQTNTQQTDYATELRYSQEENRALKNILAAIQSIDTARQNELIQFIVTDRSVRSRVISALRKSGKEISPNSNAELIVTQKPGTREALTTGGSQDYQSEVELLRIIIDQVGVYGAPTIKRILGEDLYTKINNRNDFEYTLVSSPSPQSRIQYALIDASLFGGDIIFKSGFGFGMTVGNDYVGYPFWQAGNVGVEGIIHKEMTDVRLGLNFQLGEAGITPFSISGGFNIKNRKLEGTQGFHATLEQVVDVIKNESNGRLSFGGEFYEAFTPSINTLSLRSGSPQYRTDYAGGTVYGKKDSLFYLGLTGHGWVTYSFGSTLKGAYVRLGGGTHRVDAVTIGQKGTAFGQPGYSDVVPAKSFSRFDPVVKIGYNHGGGDGYDWGIGLQYSNELLADGFIQIFSWLDLEAKYASVIGRDPDAKWEWTDFVMISPVLHLNF